MILSASCERSSSALYRMETYVRSTMGDQRVAHLALLSTERDLTEILYGNPEKVVDALASKKDRKLSFLS